MRKIKSRKRDETRRGATGKLSAGDARSETPETLFRKRAACKCGRTYAHEPCYFSRAIKYFRGWIFTQLPEYGEGREGKGDDGRGQQLYQLKVKANSETGKVKRRHTWTSFELRQRRTFMVKFTFLLSSSCVHTKLHIALSLSLYSFAVRKYALFLAARSLSHPLHRRSRPFSAIN